MVRIILLSYFTLLFMFMNTGLFSQNIYSDSWDGMMYVMFKPHVPVINTTEKIVPIQKVKVLADLEKEFGIVRIEQINYFSPDENMRRIYRVYFSEVLKIDNLIRKLVSSNDVKYAERAPIFELFYNVNDVQYLASANNRWHLEKINAEDAWQVPRQINTVKIAVVDKAMDTDHPDLVSQWDVLYDICDNDSNTNPPATVADNNASWSHGTHTSGLAGASTNNAVGVASVAYDVRLMGIKISNDYEMNIGGVNAPAGSMIAAYEAVCWAADNGADIISMSWGGRYYSLIKQEIINYAAITKSCLLLAGAGNYGTSDKYYPAALNHVMAVAGTNGDDKLNTTGMPPLYVSGGSNYGDWIDVCAPGFGMTNSNDQNTVYSTSYNDSYMAIGGTSMATPIVASLAALIKSINPALTAHAIENIIKTTCVDISSLQIDAGRQNGVGAGRINAAAAANLAYNSISSIFSDFSATRVDIRAGESIDFFDLSCGNNITSFNWTFDGAMNGSSTDQNPQNIIYPSPGIFTVSLGISNGSQTQVTQKVGFITVREPSAYWDEQASSFQMPYRSIKDIAIVDENIAWATAFDGVNEFLLTEFTRTNNGGATWVAGKITGSDIPSTYRISNIFPIDYNKAYACLHNALKPPQGTTYGGIFVTEDGGVTWTRQSAPFSSTSSFPNFVHFFNSQDGVCMGNIVNSNYEIYTTDNGGVTWQPVPSASIPTPQGGEVCIIGQYESYGDVIWFGTNKGRVYKSANKGQSWTVSQTGLYQISKITFANENIGIVQNIAKNVANTQIVTFENKRTTNGGQSWTAFTPGNGIKKTCLDFVPGHPEILLSVGTDGTANETQGSSLSTDMGLTWTPLDDGIFYSVVKMLNPETGFAGSANRNQYSGGIFKWVPENNTSVEADFSSLSGDNIKVYPNPASNFVFLQCENVNKSLTVILTDVSGKTIFSDKYIHDGYFQKKINVSNLPVGIYNLSLINGSEYTSRRIMLCE